MSPNNSVPRILQQPPEGSDGSQEKSGANEAQSRPEAQNRGQQMGEGSYEASADYKKRTEEYLKKHDVEADAEAAKPRSEEEARELKRAEDEGRSHSKGER